MPRVMFSDMCNASTEPKEEQAYSLPQSNDIPVDRITYTTGSIPALQGALYVNGSRGL